MVANGPPPAPIGTVGVGYELDVVVFGKGVIEAFEVDFWVVVALLSSTSAGWGRAVIRPKSERMRRPAMAS